MLEYFCKIGTLIGTLINAKFSWKRRNSPNVSAKSKTGIAIATMGDSISHQGGRGGSGGSPTVIGNNNYVVGGPGGAGGPGSNGGDGGGGLHHSDNLFAMGGEGGEAGQSDRGGKGGRSPFQILGIPNRKLPDGTWLWDRGRGGDGAQHSSKL